MDALQQKLKNARRLANWLDSSIRIPFTKRTFGFDAIIGLVPLLGDVLPVLYLAYHLRLAWELQAPASLYWMLSLNVALDVLLGLTPVVGDVLDAAFKSNQKNLDLLEGYFKEISALPPSQQWQARPKSSPRTVVVDVEAKPSSPH